jgi:HTH DNA binding domain
MDLRPGERRAHLSSMVRQVLKVSKQRALNLVCELALSGITGRGLFRAWGELQKRRLPRVSAETLTAE